ncbi:phosphotransferase [Demequina sp. NBRC 110053]|uniref:phosphotransferase n=1 Tax=Demequina sp. NBRC 110053 TaxID=1570342 RepID=UPI000A065ACF|nr:phosphotransferase [Demequina sp. NBRC 110053]
MARLHEQQIDVPDALVDRLIRDQAPAFAGLPRRRLPSDGTIHRVDLLGADAVARMPFIDWAGDEAGDDARRVPVLAAALAEAGIAVPEVLLRGEPSAGMPWPWGIWSRLPGRHPRRGDPHDEAAVARGVAAAMGALASIDLPWPPAPDPTFLATDDGTRDKVVALGSAAALAAWDAATDPGSDERPQWIHGDLMPGNLLLEGEGASARLTGIIDWGASGMGDRGFDLLAGWVCMGPDARVLLFDAAAATDAQIARSRAYAVRKAAWGIEYYRESLPAFASTLRYALRQAEMEA